VRTPLAPSLGKRVVQTAQDRLIKSQYIILRRVSCEFDNGVLTLNGRLPSYYLKQVAQVAVAGVDGVAEIVNRIEVESSTS